MGKAKNITNNPSKGIKDTFEKGLKSNAVGDTFVDPGQYFLRKPDPPARSKSALSGTRSVSHCTNFKPSGSNKLVRRSEFEHVHNGPPPRPDQVKLRNFLTRFACETFQ